MENLKFILATFLFMIFASPAAFADDLAEAVAATDRGDYDTAFKLLKPLAEQGNAEAQNILGIMYERGNGVAKDYTPRVRGNAIAQSAPSRAIGASS